MLSAGLVSRRTDWYGSAVGPRSRSGSGGSASPQARSYTGRSIRGCLSPAPGRDGRILYYSAPVSCGRNYEGPWRAYYSE